MIPDVYVSDDGGYTWSKALTGPHYYTILDSGGLIVAVESHVDKPIDIIKFVAFSKNIHSLVRQLTAMFAL